MTQSSIYKIQPPEEIIRLELELTSTCNLKCPLCIRTIAGEPPKNEYRSLKDILEQLDRYPNLKYVTIAGAVSEPTSHPELIGVISYLKRRDIEISLYINGDTRDDHYYMTLGVLFRECEGNIYFTICGSTQELHAQYRINSELKRVLKRLDIVNRYSGGKGILTWIVFNYNEVDFNTNYQRFKDKYTTEYFYTLPMAEHFQTGGSIRLPEKLHNLYNQQIDRNDFENITCPANKNGFVQINYEGNVNPCSLYRLHGEKHCWECSKKNLATLRNNKIFNCAEPESDTSEESLRLYYDRPQE